MRAKELIATRRDVLEAAADVLLAKETISGEELASIAAQAGGDGRSEGGREERYGSAQPSEPSSFNPSHAADVETR